MTVGAGISVADGNLMVLGNKVLSHVHDKVLVTPACGGALLNGAFIGVQSHHKGSRTVFPIGKLQYVLHTLHFSLFNFLSLSFLVACHNQELHVHELDYFRCVLLHSKCNIYDDACFISGG